MSWKFTTPHSVRTADTGEDGKPVIVRAKGSCSTREAVAGEAGIRLPWRRSRRCHCSLEQGSDLSELPCSRLQSRNHFRVVVKIR